MPYQPKQPLKPLRRRPKLGQEVGWYDPGKYGPGLVWGITELVRRKEILVRRRHGHPVAVPAGTELFIRTHDRRLWNFQGL